MNFTFPYTFEFLPGQEVELTVVATFHPEERGTRLDPGFAAYFEIDSVSLPGGVLLLEKEAPALWSAILDAASEHVPQPEEPEREGWTVGCDFSGPGRDYSAFSAFMFTTGEMKMFTGFPCSHFSGV